MGGEQPSNQPTRPVIGDFVVMKIAAHYHVSRVVLGGSPWTSIEAIDSESDALALACGLVREQQRVFLYASGSRPDHILIDCANPFWEPR